MITSAQNPKIKRLVALRKRRDRDEAGVMLVEGHDELMVALQSGVRPEEVYYCTELMSGVVDLAMMERCEEAGAAMYEVDREAFEKAAYREGPDGWLAVVPRVPNTLDRIKVGKKPLVLVCEAIEKPGNLGAMLRTAAAAGAEAVIAVDAVTDWGNPNVVRSSKGAVFTVPVANASRPELMAWLRERKIKLVAAALGGEQDMWETDLSGGVAIAIGAEHEGLSEELLADADERVEIPMVADIDSLNAATSAALLMYEAFRQRTT